MVETCDRVPVAVPVGPKPLFLPPLTTNSLHYPTTSTTTALDFDNSLATVLKILQTVLPNTGLVH